MLMIEYRKLPQARQAGQPRREHHPWAEEWTLARRLWASGMEIGIFMSNDWWYASLLLLPDLLLWLHALQISSHSDQIEAEFSAPGSIMENFSGKIGDWNIIYSCRPSGLPPLIRSCQPGARNNSVPGELWFASVVVWCPEDTRLRWARAWQ